MPALCVCHYGAQNGGLSNPISPIHKAGEKGSTEEPLWSAAVDYALHDQRKQFAEEWDNNLRLQGFAAAFRQQVTTVSAWSLMVVMPRTSARILVKNEMEPQRISTSSRSGVHRPRG